MSMTNTRYVVFTYTKKSHIKKRNIDLILALFNVECDVAD